MGRVPQLCVPAAAACAESCQASTEHSSRPSRGAGAVGNFSWLSDRRRVSQDTVMKAEINLTADERNACAQAFRSFDRDGSGTIDSKELKQVLNALGQSPPDADVFNMIREVDEDESGEIELEEFMLVVSRAKDKDNVTDDDDLLAAFVAMGGNEFELAIDLGRMLNEVDKDRSGNIDLDEFKALL